jgi:hypothetical protein
VALSLNPDTADDYETQSLADMRSMVFGSLAFIDPITYLSAQRTFANLRADILASLGFSAGLSYTPPRTLKQIRDSIVNRLGLALPLVAGFLDSFNNISADVYNALGYAGQPVSPPGVSTLIGLWVDQAQQTLWSRIEFDKGSGGSTANARPPKFVAGANSVIDATAIRMLAIAYGKAHDGSPDAAGWKNECEKYLADLTQRTPPNIIGLCNATIIGAHNTLIRRFEVNSPVTDLTFGKKIMQSGDYRDVSAGGGSDADVAQADDNAVELLALAMIKEKIGHPDAKAAQAQYDQYLADLMKYSPPGYLDAVNSALTSAHETIYRRYVVGFVGPTQHAQTPGSTVDRFRLDGDLPVVDDQAVYLLALAGLEQKYAVPSYKQTRMDYETYMDDLFKRSPPYATRAINSILKQVQEQLYRQYSLFRCKYWYTWTLLAGQRFYGTFGHDAASALPPTAVTAVIGNPVTSHMMKQARYFAAGVTLDSGKVLVMGGYDAAGNILKSAELFDPAVGTWTSTANRMNFPRAHHTATKLLDGTVLIVGDVFGNAATTAEIYDPDFDTFTPVGATVKQRLLHTATLLLDGRVLIVGGQIDTTSAELFDPATKKFTATAPPTVARNGHCAALVADGRVLVAGGAAQNTCECFSPVAGTWTAVPGTLSSIRNYATATTTGDGRVLIAGGTTTTLITGAVNTADIFDPFVTGLAPVAGTMTFTRSSHSAIQLPNGFVLIAGDNNGSAGAELYDPGAGTFQVVPFAMPVGVSCGTINTTLNGRVLIAGGVTATVLPNQQHPGAKPAVSTCMFYDYAPRTFNFTGNLNWGTASYYRVRAVTPNGAGGPSIVVQVVAVPHDNAVVVGWTPAPGQTFVRWFDVYRSNSNFGGTPTNQQFIARVPATQTSYIDEGTAPQTGLPMDSPSMVLDSSRGPGRLDPRKIEWVGISQDNVSWRELVIGVPPTTYNNNQQGIPQFAEIRQAIELWPTPAMTGWKLRIKGSFAPFVFEADTDRTTIDWQAIWFFAVAECKATFKRLDGRPLFSQFDIVNAQAKADEYLGNLVAGSHMGQRYVPGEPVRRNAVQPILLPLPP